MFVLAASDPNWFYSTLAQSTAAIVGLAGAFLVQRLLVERAEIGPVRQRLRQDALSVHEEIRWLNSNSRDVDIVLGEVSERARRVGRGDWKAEFGGEKVALLDGGGIGGADRLVEPRGFDAIEMLEGARKVLSETRESTSISWEEVAEAIRTAGRLPLAPFLWLEEPPLRPSSQGAPPGHGIWPGMESQAYIAAMRWRTANEKAQECGRLAADLRSRLAPQSMYILFAILAGLLVAGVVAPVFFLSAQSGPSKWILLGLFVPLACAFVGFYGWELRRLRRADRIINENF